MADDRGELLAAGQAGNIAAILAEEAEIIGQIRRRGALSRTDLARLTGYSRAKITPLVGRLLASGILEEIGDGASQGGRRPRLIHFNSSQGCVIGVDIGATSLDVALADLAGQIGERVSEPTDVRLGPEAVLDRVRTCAEALLARRGIDPRQVYTLGVGVPGPVQFATGLLIAPPLMPRWERYPIAAHLRRSFPNARVVVDNDVNVMALGELWRGAGVGVENLIFVKIGTGIGAGIVCHGAVYRGSSGCAGDIGHILADPGGAVCTCGNVGCLEAVAAAPPIAARAVAAAEAGESAFLAERLRAAGALTAADVADAAAHGDLAALAIIQRSGRLIGDVLASLVNFFNPGLILIGGGVSQIGNQLLANIRQRILRRSTPLATRDLRVEYASLGLDAGVTGAVALALEHAFVVERG
ncbi:MAG TPA: ROK family transcriptional regulator [Chloroflexaceae bacterium]|nr:ROK family transcriptional regulator [Chloroflexaceae bacterium]